MCIILHPIFFLYRWYIAAASEFLIYKMQPHRLASYQKDLGASNLGARAFLQHTKCRKDLVQIFSLMLKL